MIATERTPLTSRPAAAPSKVGIGYFSSLAIAINNLTGPGMLDL